MGRRVRGDSEREGGERREAEEEEDEGENPSTPPPYPPFSPSTVFSLLSSKSAFHRKRDERKDKGRNKQEW